MGDTGSAARGTSLQTLEHEAEILVLFQLDLLAQVEAQLRAVHHTMRRIEKLRAGKSRVGPELSDGQRRDTLDGLRLELEALDAHLLSQHQCCLDMHGIVEKMQAVLGGIKRAAEQPERESVNEPAEAKEATKDHEPPENDGSVGAQ
jgi:hypothetical protein